MSTNKSLVKDAPLKLRRFTFSGLNFGTAGMEVVPSLFRLSEGIESFERIGKQVYIDTISIFFTIRLTEGLQDLFNVRFSLLFFDKNQRDDKFMPHWCDFSVNSGERIYWTPKLDLWNRMIFLEDKVTCVKSNHSFDLEIDGTTLTYSKGGVYSFSQTYKIGAVAEYSNQSFPYNVDAALWVISDTDIPLVSNQSLSITGWGQITYVDK